MMDEATLRVTAEQVRAFRRRTNGLGRRLPAGDEALRQAAWAGLQDSMPRAALLSLHARVADVGPDALDDPALVQVWGPRFSVHVVAASDVAPFTLGRLPTSARGRSRAEDTAARLRDRFGDGEPVRYGDAGEALGVHPNALRYAAPTGTVHLSWDGARQPTIRVVDPPDVDPRDARHDLARRFLHVLGPSTPAAFKRWAGIGAHDARTTYDELTDELVGVHTPVGDGWVLAEDDPALRTDDEDAREDGVRVRLLPSGDAYRLLWGEQRELLVADAEDRERLWTPRVWPGALLVDGEVVGTWRRAGATATVEPWRAMSAPERDAVEAEAASLPLPGLDARVTVDWEG